MKKPVNGAYWSAAEVEMGIRVWGGGSMLFVCFCTGPELQTPPTILDKLLAYRTLSGHIEDSVIVRGFHFRFEVIVISVDYRTEYCSRHLCVQSLSC